MGRETTPKASRRRGNWFMCSSCAAILALTTSAVEAGADDEALSLRLPAALSRFANYGDVAGVGGASAGSKWSSSVNPAAVAWQPQPGDLHLSLSPQYSNVGFSEGTMLHVAAEALTWDLGDFGAFQPSLAQVRSNHATTRQGLDSALDMDLVQLQWAKRVTEDWALGANFNFTMAKSQFDLGETAVSDSNSETYGFRLGSLNRLAERLLAGVVFDYAFSPSRTTIYDFLGLGIGNTRTKDTGQQFILRPGLSYEYRKDSSIFADYQFGVFRDDTGSLEVHRFYLGVDHSVYKWLFLRTGVALDARGHAAWAAGLGFYPCDRFSIDVAFQENMFPELQPEFGRSRTLTISVSVVF